MSDDLTQPLIGDSIDTHSLLDDKYNKSITFDPEVRASDVGYPLDGPRTTSTNKNKSPFIGITRFGSSKTAEPEDLAEDEKRKAAQKELKNKDEYLKKYGKEQFIAEYGDNEYNKLYVCDDEEKFCGDKCVILGGKKTKRRRYTRKYTKKHRSRKSRRSKKGSKNTNK